eukprot:UN01545
MAEYKSDDMKDGGNPWIEVFAACGKINVDEKVKIISDWGLELMDMLHADKQDTDDLCEALGLESIQTKKFKNAVSKCLIKYSPWSFLGETLNEEKQSGELIQSLNVIEKPASMITDDDIKKICDECEINVGDVRNVIGWYKTLEPLTGQTKGQITAQMITGYIKKLYTAFDLPFFAMEEADDEDIDQLAADVGLNKEQIGHFKTNVASQLKIGWVNDCTKRIKTNNKTRKNI